jgi:hypothetical protein
MPSLAGFGSGGLGLGAIDGEEGGVLPIFGQTYTAKLTISQQIMWTSPFGDQLIHTTYTKTTTGKEGIYTLDHSSNNNEAEGASLGYGGLSFGYGYDGSAGIAYDNGKDLEVHGSFGIGNGFGQMTIGNIQTSDGVSAGNDYTVKAGGYIGGLMLLTSISVAGVTAF